MRTYEDYLKLNIPEQFGCTDGSDAIVDDSIYDQLDSETETYFGITQFVIVDPDLDEVIKIPFNGTEECIYGDDSDDDKYVFEYFDIDYTVRAMELYEKVEKAGFSIFFSKMTKIGSTENGVPVYRQEYTTPIADSSSPEIPSEDSIKKVEKAVKKSREEGSWKWRNFHENWLASAVDFYGYDMVSKFLDYIAEQQKLGYFDDLHSGNYGWRRDGSPAILDWAGYL